MSDNPLTIDEWLEMNALGEESIFELTEYGLARLEELTERFRLYGEEDDE